MTLLESQFVNVTHNVTFNTTVRGVGVENFTYQWRHNGTNITDEINDTLIITNVMTSDTGDYECVVTNEYGDSATSNVVVVTVISELYIWLYMLISVIISFVQCTITSIYWVLHLKTP